MIVTEYLKKQLNYHSTSFISSSFLFSVGAASFWGEKFKQNNNNNNKK
jgi:hypothetical protein